MSKKTSMKYFSESLAAGSEEDFDIICDLCHTENKRVEAAAYCVDCGEHLCKECRRYHKKTSATRNHVIQDNIKTPTTQTGEKEIPGSSNTADALIDKCEKHPQELVKFYCNLHKQLACSVCVSSHHISCVDVSYIPAISSGTAGCEELKNLQAEMMKLVAGLERSNSRSEWCQGVTEESYQQMKDTVKQFRQNINQMIDDLETELFKEAARLRKEIMDSLRSEETKCSDLVEQIKKMNFDMDKKSELKYNNRLFVAMKYASEKNQSFEEEADGISQTVEKRLVFMPNEKLDDLPVHISNLGTLSLVGKSGDIKAEYVDSINVKSDWDTDDCNINGIAALPDGRLAVTDFRNKAVKLIDIKHKNVSQEIKLGLKPKNITLVEDNKLAVLLFDTNRIQFLSILPTLSKSHIVELPGRYNGIAYNEGRLIMTCHNPSRSVHICDLSGNLLHQIDTDCTGSMLCGAAIAVSPDRNIIYIVDFKTNKIVLLNEKGKFLSSYANDKLQCLEGIAVDAFGYIYVCSRITHTVLQLSPNGKSIKQMLEEKDGLLFPSALAHSAGKLYISSNSKEPATKNKINVYRLE